MPKRIPHYHCPVNGHDCIYYLDSIKFTKNAEEEHCICNIDEEGYNPYYECDDFFDVYGVGCEPDDYTDYYEED